MGVTGLWTVVQPCARPIKLETLNKKRLAVDASIWIYQFLKAVRDKEGNALRNSHVVGFFRRICKLLFVGILPVFVFDGGAPSLKRQTITARKRRREGRKEDATRTAGKLLALQMQRAAEDEEEKRKREARRDVEEEEVPDAEKLVYVDELQMTQQERVQNRKFRKKDQYHLPELETSLAEMGAPNDPRIMSIEELEAYARQFDTGEDINVYDFSKIDFDSPFFTSLPASDRYNILNAARLRSRLRMGYSKEQLDSMFPNRMDFSRFQIERVSERNELTQRLMNINGMNDDGMWGINGTGRVAGEKGREYVLVRNEGVEGGWALGVVTNKDEGQREKPIDVDELAREAEVKQEDGEEGQSDEDFEDVPIEGLNRLPKPGSNVFTDPAQQEVTRKRRALYASRKPRKPRAKQPTATPANDDPESLFVAEQPENEEVENGDVEEAEYSDNEELNRAIALSLQQDDAEEPKTDDQGTENNDDYLGVFQQRRVDDAPSIQDSQGRSAQAIARTVNARAAKVPTSSLFQAESDSEGEANGVNGSQSPYYDKPAETVRQTKDQQRASKVQAAVSESSKPKPKSANPLPFERLDLGASLFGKKKIEQMEQNTAGGFERDSDKKEARPVPPWFAGNPDTDMEAQKEIEKADREKAKRFQDEQNFQFSEPSVLRRNDTGDVIDLDAPESENQPKEVLVIDDEDAESQQADRDGETQRSEDKVEDKTMGGMADDIKAAPPAAPLPTQGSMPPVIRDVPHPDASEDVVVDSSLTANEKADNAIQPQSADEQEHDEEIEWSESDDEKRPVSEAVDKQNGSKIAGNTATLSQRSESPDFEDVTIPDRPVETPKQQNDLAAQTDQQETTKNHVSDAADQNAPAAEEGEEDFGLLSDSEDEDLMRQLEIEAQEHARFASELNAKSQAANMADYERELKQLRTQQKKDRRDADEVTQIMITECQQLLRLFGLPYITAPMEAEAQCAELVRLGLVDGIVTDDSDCFLFGGTRVYKNMFNQAKFVECYLLTDLEKEFDLTRQKLIGIAQLLGSDYTEGLPGVGPVTALEILSEFPDLKDFSQWWAGVQEGRVKREVDAGKPFRRKFRKTNATKLFLPPAFPDPRVEMAYIQPEVDSDPSEFQWGVPDLDALRSFLMATIGWSQERTDEVLVPVIRDMNRRAEEGTQSNITKFFSGGTGAGSYAPRVRAAETSKRLGGALGRMAERAKRKRKGLDAAGEDTAAGKDGAAEAAAEDQDHTGEQTAPPTKPKRGRKRKSAAEQEDSGDDDEDADFGESEKPKRQRKAGGRKKAAKADGSE